MSPVNSFITSAPPGWDQLTTESGLSALAVADQLRASGSSGLQINTALRAIGHEPSLVAAVVTQVDLRAKALQKFGPQAQGMLFTQAGLEQASRSRVADLHAARFHATGCRVVADLGCGIGSESMALLDHDITPIPIEIDPFTAIIADHNLSVKAKLRAASRPSVTVADATGAAAQVVLAEAEGAFLDPARRTAGQRNTKRIADPDDYSPSLTFAFDLASRMPTGIKLGPGFDRELIPEDAEAQWVSVDGQLVETGLWFGPLARPGIGRSALILRGADTMHELCSAADSPDVEVRSLGEFLYEPDGAVIRARLIGLLADQLSAATISENIAYLTGDTQVHSPFCQGFRILERFPANEKVLRKALAHRRIGSLEIKKRGIDIDPALFRKKLKLAGDQHATLILTRSKGKHTALLAERITD